MEALIRATNKLTIKVEGDDAKALFKQIAKAGEVFGVGQCGCCSSQDLAFKVRTVSNGEYEYYELWCLDRSCRARLQFGLTKKGDLYPRRKDKDGNWLDNEGWARWTPGQQDQRPPQDEREF